MKIRTVRSMNMVTSLFLAVLFCAMWSHKVGAFEGRKLSNDERAALDAAWAISENRRKGPFGKNTCVCTDGRSGTVLRPNGEIRNICGAETLFCAAFKAEHGMSLEDQRVYVANIFSRDLYDWDRFEDHDDLVRGYILERFVIGTLPDSKLAQVRQYSGLSGAEYEIVAQREFFERYLTRADYNDFRHYLLAYELQKRNFARGGFGKMQEVRDMASRVQALDPKFKPLRDATHNQVSAGLIPLLADYRDTRAGPRTSKMIDTLINEIQLLTSLEIEALDADIADIEDTTLRGALAAQANLAGTAEGVERLTHLGEVMRLARDAVADGAVSPADRRRSIDLNVIAAAVMQSEGTRVVTEGTMSVGEGLATMRALVDGAYGVGLLSSRERDAASSNIDAALAQPVQNRAELERRLDLSERVVEWAQNSAVLAFSEVWSQWVHLVPETVRLPDDILRGSPLLLYAEVHQKVSDYVSGSGSERHELAGQAFTGGVVRALNPGMAIGPLLLNPESGSYARSDLVALEATPEDLQPTAGILTQGEGNVVSHVQLLARALGIPNAVTASGPFDVVEELADRDVFYAVTPGGRVILKAADEMTALEIEVYAEYTGNLKRSDDGALAVGGTSKLHIDKDRLDLTATAPVDLATLRQSDSGIVSGPKAAFLGELKHLFPDNVADGVVLPFGVYFEHYKRASVAVPAELADQGIATPGEPLTDFVRATYATFFGEMIPGGSSEKELSAWIQPRLDVIAESITSAPLDEAIKSQIATELSKVGLIDPNDPNRTTGVFVRSDTNVEDLENFNGAGLNLTIFNLVELDDIYEGVKRVWASPFRYRSFSWRQTLIDDPEWVLPSIIILQSIPSEKSGVAVTADINSGNPEAILIATSEGVGGAVDGTPAETLLWSAEETELVTMFKSPTRRLLKAEGGLEVVASTGLEYVLETAEVDALVEASQKIEASLQPALNSAGVPRPWDIEYGFANGKLWLFQSRPFIGSEEVANLPALSRLDVPRPPMSETVSLVEIVPE